MEIHLKVLSGGNNLFKRGWCQDHCLGKKGGGKMQRFQDTSLCDITTEGFCAAPRGQPFQPPTETNFLGALSRNKPPDRKPVTQTCARVRILFKSHSFWREIAGAGRVALARLSFPREDRRQRRRRPRTPPGPPRAERSPHRPRPPRRCPPPRSPRRPAPPLCRGLGPEAKV